MAFTISQRQPVPYILEPEGTGSFTIDVGADVPISGQTEWIAVKFPAETAFPSPGGEVRYIAANGTVNNLLTPQWDPANRLLRFQHELHLHDGTPAQNGFYSISVQAQPNAEPDEWTALDGLSIGTTTANLTFRISPPQPVEQKVYGLVHGASNSSIISGSGFTLRRRSVGTYEITFNNAFAMPPAVTVTAYSSGDNVLHNAKLNWVEAKKFGVCTGHINGTLLDLYFSFIAIGLAPPPQH
jgi:hypothetical protein